MNEAAASSLEEMLRGPRYLGYAYAYPHKTAYRRFETPRKLADVWRDEPRDSLFLYFHIPFCEMRCGFCNLFTQSLSRAGMNPELERQYLSALERQIGVAQDALGTTQFVAGAIGGGTPTFLSPDGLARLMSLFRGMHGGKQMDVSVEASPFTATPERLKILREGGVTRLSIGVQSFVDAEVAASGRAQPSEEVRRALRNSRDAGFPILNLDLIYGLPGQSRASWLASVREALEWSPEEIYLYPLYVRPLTGLGRKCAAGQEHDPEWDALRLDCYRAARDLLLQSGYRVLSMRHFRHSRAPQGAGDYTCQEDGTLALGCGGRSYTRALHYSCEYAVSGGGVAEIIREYTKDSASGFAEVRYGFDLDPIEQRRRYVIKSLLRSDGLVLSKYESYFGSDAREDFPALVELLRLNLAVGDGTAITPTAAGLEASDVIGPWLVSTSVRRRMDAFVLR